jgi:hypothetical protein
LKLGAAARVCDVVAAIRSFVVIAAAVCGPALCLSLSEDLTVRRVGDQFQVTAPRLHFLTGRPLERLRNGAAVPFDFQLTLFAGSKSNAVERALDRFVVSYDLWEEKFSVVRLRDFRKSSPNLSAGAAESWCLQNVLLAAQGVPADKDLWVRLEIRSAEMKPQNGATENSGINLATLIEIFSRPAQARQERWMLETGPFRLAELSR